MLSFVLASCEHKELCYEHPHDKEVEVIFNWENIFPENIPTTVCVRFNTVGIDSPDYEFYLPSKGGTVILPEDSYSAIAYTDASDLVVRGNQVSEIVLSSPEAYHPTKEETIHNAPEHLCSGSHEHLELFGHAGKKRTVTFNMTQNVCQFTYEVRGIKNLRNAKQAYFMFSGTSAEFHVAKCRTIESQCEGHTKTIWGESEIEGDIITGSFNSYGCGYTQDEIASYTSKHIFTTYVIGKNGKHIEIHSDVTSQADCQGELHDVHLIIEIEGEVPNENDGNNDSSMFDPNVDEWEDEETDIPL